MGMEFYLLEKNGHRRDLDLAPRKRNIGPLTAVGNSQHFQVGLGFGIREVIDLGFLCVRLFSFPVKFRYLVLGSIVQIYGFRMQENRRRIIIDLANDMIVIRLIENDKIIR